MIDKYEKEFYRKNKDFKPTKNSGQTHDDADFRLGNDWLVEHKYKSIKSISISNTIWKKIRKQAIMRSRKPVLIYTNEKLQVAVLDLEDFKELQCS